jgi:hypothetical protein
MFEFRFKRPGDASEAGTEAGVQPEPAVSPQRAEQAERLRALGGDETAAADFILQSEFSDLRLAAADLIVSQPQLERVHSAIRNTDRRVAKLLQGRLDAIRHHQSELLRGQACIEQARHLLAEERLTPNHVADLDRSWSVVAAPELVAQFDALRAAISARLDAQTALQRAVIDSVALLRQLGDARLPAGELAAQLAQLAAAHAAARAAPEHASLPRQLLAEFAAAHARVSATVEVLGQHQDAIAAREALLAGWQAAPAAQLDAQAMRRAWNALAQLPAGELADQLQQQLDALVASAPQGEAKQANPAKPARQKAPPVAIDPQWLATLEAMEAALQQGSLQAAADSDKHLKENKAARLSPAQADRLAHARAELKRLSDWARWGGNVSREELIKAVEQLASQKQAMSELAKKVGSMRERWKGLDTLSGPAPKGLWERFDAACSAAYAPAAAHFKHLADERSNNGAKARALVEEAVAAAAPLIDAAAPDWKKIAAAVQRLKQAWGHLGAIDRKEKKKLDGLFAAAIDKLQAPLGEQRKSEVARREQLIADVAALNAADRHSLDALRSAQERWQELARALPLERKAEQALWTRFRAACDAVFSARKESAHAADAERHAHQKAKEAICERLEAGASANAGDVARLLREAAAEWRTIGAVPRANEAKLEKRHHAAIAALDKVVEGARRQAGVAQATALRDKLRLCQALEASIAGAPGEGDDWDGRWSALPPLNGELERALAGRWKAARAAHENGREAYARLLEQNRETLLREILRLEIVAGVDSGSEFARDRLKLQVEVLQSSLKSGQKPVSQAAQLLQLCAMPALVDGRTASRIEHLFRRVGKEGK